MTTTDYSTRLSTAENLDELLEAIEAAEAAGTFDLHDLPTFGGDAPADTAGIYSWDERRLLVGPGGARDSHSVFAIVDRARTTTTITNAGLRKLQTEAAENGDEAMWAHCQIALHGTYSATDVDDAEASDEYQPLYMTALRKLASDGVTQERARAECEAVLAGAVYSLDG